MRPVVYIAGRMSSPDIIEVLQNFQRFTECENAMLKHGFAPVNPGADVPAVALGGVTYEDCMEKDRALILRCDAVYFLRGWKDSPGARREHKWASAKQIPCVEEPEEGYSNFDELKQAIYDMHTWDWYRERI